MQTNMLLFLLLLIITASSSTPSYGLIYEGTYVFELMPVPSFVSAGGRGALDDVSLVGSTQRALTAYYQVIDTHPYMLDTNGVIEVTLFGDGLTYNTASYVNYIDTLVKGSIPKKAANNQSTPAPETSVQMTRLFFMLNQPRLYCIYVAPSVAPTGDGDEPMLSGGGPAEEDPAEEDPADHNCQGHVPSASQLAAPTPGRLLTKDFMELESSMQLMIFDVDTWYRIETGVQTKHADVGEASDSPQKRSGIGCQDFLHRGNSVYNLQTDSAKVCSAPALYTIPLDRLGENYNINKASTILLVHKYPAAHLVAVLAQCSAVPLSISVSVRFDNIGTGSMEYYMTAVVFFVFLILYSLMLIIFLAMFIRCGGKKRSQTTAATAASPAVDETASSDTDNAAQAAAVSCSSSAEAAVPGGAPYHRRTNSETSARSLTAASDNLSRRNTDDYADLHSSHGEDSGEHYSSNPFVVWFAVKWAAFSNWLQTSHINIMYPPMQWIVLVLIPLNCMYDVLRAAEFSLLSGMELMSDINALPTVSSIFMVCSKTLLIALEVLVCVGWGLAYHSLTLWKKVYLSIVCIGAVVIYSILSSCTIGRQTISISTNVYVRAKVGEHCTAISYARVAFELFVHVVNAVLLCAITMKLGKQVLRGDGGDASLMLSFDKPEVVSSSDEEDAGGWSGSSSSTSNDDVGEEGTHEVEEDARPQAQQGKTDRSEAGGAVRAKAMILYLRYRDMRLPFSFMIVWSLIYIYVALVFFRREDYYMEVAFSEFSRFYFLTFVIVFFRYDPFYF